MELLDTGAPPGAFERFATGALRRRGVRIAVAAVTAVVVGAGAAAGLAHELEPSTRSEPEGARAAVHPGSDGYEPEPWVTQREIGWAVLGRPAVSRRGHGYVVTVRAVNRSLEPTSPQELSAVGRFDGRPGLGFSAACEGFDWDVAGFPRPVRSVVEPGERVLLRCTDTRKHSSNRPALDLRSIRVEDVTCDHEGRGPA